MSIRWTEAEKAMLAECARDRVPRHQIPTYFPDRKVQAVYTKFARMFPLANRQAEEEEEKLQEISQQGLDGESIRAAINLKQDQAFQRAMRRAIKQKLESPPIGVYVAPDRETWSPRFFPRGIVRSFMSSPAAECASLAS